MLFENAAATGVALMAIIFAVGPVSGAHLNPIITLVDRAYGGVSTSEAGAYMAAQVTGGIVGVILANLMFSLPAIQVSTKTRTGAGLWLGEVIATFGLVLVVFAVVRSDRTALAPFAIGAYIAGAYFFTSSTSFANPAVTTARSLSNTFAGIKPSSVPASIVAQLVGGALAVGAVLVLYPSVGMVADRVVVPHEEGGSP